MLAYSGIFLLLVSWAVFQWTLRRGAYKRYPHEQFVLVGASALTGVATVLEQPSVLHVSLFAIELTALGVLTWYMTIGARFARGEVKLSLGDRFPEFRLPDSHGELVDSRSLEGKTSLYLFYRGPW